MIKGLIIVLCLMGLANVASASLVVRKTYYRDTNLSLHVFLENRGTEPMALKAPIVGGFDTATLGRDGKTAGSVLWYRCWPNPVPPGGIADMTITMAAAPDGPIEIEIPAGAGSRISVSVPCKPEAFRFQAIRFSKDLCTVYAYLCWADGDSDESLKSIRIDGRSVARQAAPWPARGSDGLAYVKIALKTPLEKGSFHVFEAETASGLSTAYQIRAIPAEFIVGTYGAASPTNIRDWAAHELNHYLSFGSLPPEVMSILSANGLSCGARWIPEPLSDRKAGKVLAFDEEASLEIIKGLAADENVLYHSLVDEPDVDDYFAGRRLGACGMELVAREELCREADPGHYTFVQLDNTFRPRNYQVYGESADVLATHRYSLGSYIGSEGGGATQAQHLQFLEDLRETVVRLRNASAPRPFFMVTQFFDLGPGRQGRPPVIEEMRLQCYAMVAGGARGLIHYIHSGSSARHEGGKTPALWDAMTPMHAELKRVGEVVSIGSVAPEGWVKASSANLYARALVCGDKMAVVLINRAHRTELERFVASPVRDVNVTVRIPAWVGAGRFAVTAADDMDSSVQVAQGSELVFSVDEVKDARCYLIEPRR